jgi:hypothetical protein
MPLAGVGLTSLLSTISRRPCAVAAQGLEIITEWLRAVRRNPEEKSVVEFQAFTKIYATAPALACFSSAAVSFAPVPRNSSTAHLTRAISGDAT